MPPIITQLHKVVKCTTNQAAYIVPLQTNLTKQFERMKQVTYNNFDIQVIRKVADVSMFRHHACHQILGHPEEGR